MSDKVINITSNGIKQAIDDLVNEMLQNKDYKLEGIIKEALKYIEIVRTLAMVDKINILSVSELEKILKGSDKE